MTLYPFSHEKRQIKHAFGRSLCHDTVLFSHANVLLHYYELLCPLSRQRQGSSATNHYRNSTFYFPVLLLAYSLTFSICNQRCGGGWNHHCGKRMEFFGWLHRRRLTSCKYLCLCYGRSQFSWRILSVRWNGANEGHRGTCYLSIFMPNRYPSMITRSNFSVNFHLFRADF